MHRLNACWTIWVLVFVVGVCLQLRCWPTSNQPIFRLTSGLANYQVIQRQGDTASIYLAGESTLEGSVEVEVTTRGRVVPGFAAQALATTCAGVWLGRLQA